jgi:hypothetical protein
VPDTFDGFPVAAWTRHFCVTYTDGDPDALARAQAIASICEADLSKLQLWFDCNYDSSPYSIWVHVEPGVHGAGAYNYGYEDNESSRIGITGTFRPPAPPLNVNSIRDDYARMLFAAELTEILADFSGRGGGKVWDRSTSSGEALSRVAGAELHPFGYYASGKGPAINNWLQSSANAVGEPFRRWDFVTAYERTDLNDLSYGCGILFLNYLRYQWGYSFPQIVQASGSSLAETFSRLTTKPASDAFPSFEALLEKHFVFPRYAYAPTDNVFPLYDNPSVGLLVNSESLTPQPEGKQRVAGLPFGGHHITLKAGPLCPETDYTYWIEHIPVHYTVQAVTRGFARADFAWSVGGTPLPVIGLSEEAIVNVEITHTTPVPPRRLRHPCPSDTPFNSETIRARCSFGMIRFPATATSTSAS